MHPWHITYQENPGNPPDPKLGVYIIYIYMLYIYIYLTRDVITTHNINTLQYLPSNSHCYGWQGPFFTANFPAPDPTISFSTSDSTCPKSFCRKSAVTKPLRRLCVTSTGKISWPVNLTPKVTNLPRNSRPYDQGLWPVLSAKKGPYWTGGGVGWPDRKT